MLLFQFLHMLKEWYFLKELIEDFYNMKESKFGTIRRWKKGRGKGIIRKKGIKIQKRRVAPLAWEEYTKITKDYTHCTTSP